MAERSQDWVNQLVKEAAAQAGGTLSFDDALRAATNVGISEAQLLNALSTGVVTDYGDYVRAAPEAESISNVWNQELGVAPADIDYALSLAHLKAGGTLESGREFFDNSEQGQEYNKYLLKFPNSGVSQSNLGALNAVKQLQSVSPVKFGDAPATGSPTGFTTTLDMPKSSPALGAGDADYNSEMIRSLRESGNQPISSNSGFTRYQSAATPGGNQNFNLNSGGAFNPSAINQDVASAGDVSDWNSYNTYRTNSLQARTPYTSFDEWLAGGKVSGVPQPVATTPNTYNTINESYGP
jgi:hypothetical protein